MLRLLAIAFVTISSSAWAGFDEEAAYASWKANYSDCINPTDDDGFNECRQKVYIPSEQLEKRGWCWVAYDQDMMRPGSSRYLNEHFGVATCPLKKN
jgi:hypothetical protein